MKIPKEERAVKNKLYQRLKRVHYTMVRRCTVEGSTGYENYGAKGVKVDPRWLDFENFIEDIDKLPGWVSGEDYVKRKLSLDKDSKWGNKLYSKDTCRLITAEENNHTKPNQQYRIIGMSPDGEIYKFHSANKFAKEHNLNYTSIIKVAKGETKSKHHKEWQFCLEENYREDYFVEPYSWYRYIIGLSPSGETYRFHNASKFSREHEDIIEATVIYACANGKITHTRLWQFRYEEDLEVKPFLDISELRGTFKKGVKFIAINPEGKIYKTNNRTKFSEEHKLNSEAIKDILNGNRDNYKGWKFYYDK